MAGTILIYGSNGYTGELIVDLAVSQGASPTLAGRTREKILPQAAQHRLDYRIFGLEDPAAVDKGLEGIDVVLHCAGPFSRTADAMAEGCIRAKAHYLDITGEIDVFEAMATKTYTAKTKGVMLMPGTGFDVVPTDCLAAHVKNRLPSATDLTLAIHANMKPSRGTATTMIENIHAGGMIRENGELTPVPSLWKTQQFDFGEGPLDAMTIPWGDVSTAFYTTGIPNIQVYMAASPALRRMASFSRRFSWLLASGPVQSFLKGRIQSGPPGPSAEDRASGSARVLAIASGAEGETVSSLLSCPEGYTLTAQTAWAIAKRAADGDAPSGFQTPAMAYGADFILEFEGTERTDLD